MLANNADWFDSDLLQQQAVQDQWIINNRSWLCVYHNLTEVPIILLTYNKSRACTQSPTQWIIYEYEEIGVSLSDAGSIFREQSWQNIWQSLRLHTVKITKTAKRRKTRNKRSSGWRTSVSVGDVVRSRGSLALCVVCVWATMIWWAHSRPEDNDKQIIGQKKELNSLCASLHIFSTNTIFAMRICKQCFSLHQ